MRRSTVFALIALLTMVFASPASAGESNWKVYTYNPSGNAFSSRQADEGPAFTFTTDPDTALFAALHLDGSDTLTGKTITATFRIDAPAGTTFQYYGQPDTCGTPASVRLYFSTNGPMGSKKDWYSNYWWSTAPSSQVLENGTFTISATISPNNWSNWNGKGGLERPAGFAAAAADPALIGFSFGGGCFYENGVGARDGTATFTLLDFDIIGN